MRFKKVISVVLVIVVIASCVTIPGAAKVSDKVQKCDFTIFAGSCDDDAIIFNASNVCVNGNIVTNGKIKSINTM